MILAIIADVLQIVVFPLFVEGALSPAEDISVDRKLMRERVHRTGAPQDLTIKQVQPDESETPINIIQREALTSVFASVIEDGSYALRYIFDGKQEEHRARVQRGTLVSGVAA